jgi:hypothetical protein
METQKMEFQLSQMTWNSYISYVFWVRVPAGAGDFPSHHRVQTGSGDHTASYPMGTRGSFPGGKTAGAEANHSPPFSAEVIECVELYIQSLNTPSRRSAQLKHKDNFTFYTKML